MANTPQSKKRARQNDRKLEVNKARSCLLYTSPSPRDRG